MALRIEDIRKVVVDENNKSLNYYINIHTLEKVNESDVPFGFVEEYTGKI